MMIYLKDPTVSNRKLFDVMNIVKFQNTSTSAETNAK